MTILLTASLFAPLLLATAGPAPSALASWSFDDCDPAAAAFASSPGASFAGTKTGFVGCNIGRRGLAGAFHGASSVDIADGAHVLDVDGGGFTLAAWVRPRPGGMVASRRRSWSVSADASGVHAEVQWACGTFAPCRLAVAGPPLADRWTHLAVVYRTSSPSWSVRSLELFVDGQAVAAQTTDQGWAPLRNRGELVRIGAGAPGPAFRGLIDETTLYGAALSGESIAWLASLPDERLRIVFSTGESQFRPDARAELTRIKQAGFNALWIYFDGPSNGGSAETRRALADACLAEGVGVIAQGNYVQELATHPALIGFWTFDEPTANGIPITEQRAAYAAVKAVTSKPVFVVHTDFNDVSFRRLYSPDVQDVVAFDLYPYASAPNPTGTLEQAKWLIFTGISRLFLNRISDLDKSKVSRLIPVLGSFVDPPEWVKGDTYGDHLFWDRLAGHPASHGVFLWSYPTTTTFPLIGLGQGRDYPVAQQLYDEYQQFRAQTLSFDDLDFQYFTGRDLAERATPGTYGISPYNLNPDPQTGAGSGRFGVTANAQGSTVDFVIPLRKGSGRPFRHVYAAALSVNDAGSPYDRVEITLEVLGHPELSSTWPLGNGYRHVPQALDLGGEVTQATVHIQVRWDTHTSPYAAVLGAAFALE
jgi:concanavalin A-like lectin/glucanase superfamily protein